MGTRGLAGFRYKAKDYFMYNHWDSYPETLGIKVLKACKEVKNYRAVQFYIMQMTLVDDTLKPTDKQIEILKSYADTTVNTRSLQDWYCLLRRAQGEVELYLKGKLKYMLNNNNFIHNSLGCEWAYIVNLDSMMLEVWKGFQTTPDENNRYGTEYDKDIYEKTGSKYYPCKLIREYPLKKLPKDKDFIRELKQRGEQE